MVPDSARLYSLADELRSVACMGPCGTSRTSLSSRYSGGDVPGRGAGCRHRARLRGDAVRETFRSDLSHLGPALGAEDVVVCDGMILLTRRVDGWSAGCPRRRS